MTEKERREMMQNNYAAQMEMLGFDNSGNSMDMVCVVRCKNCMHWATDWIPENNSGHFCPIIDNFTTAEWYCADGEIDETN